MNKLAVALIGQDRADWLDMALTSVKGADLIVYIDGGSIDNSIEVAKKHNAVVIKRRYEQEHKGANGRARNAYLHYLKENCKDWTCLVIDPDEVVQDFNVLLDDVRNNRLKYDFYSPKMRHIINDFLHEDATLPEHWCPNRLFKVTDDIFYPETEHTVLTTINKKIAFSYDRICLWHFGTALHLMQRLNKYKNDLAKSQTHSSDFLKNWYYSHITNKYPTAEISLSELPQAIKDKFELNELQDRLYFENRTALKHEHWIDASQWKEFFKCKTALDIGCGVGHRVLTLNELGVDAYGCDISQWAVDNSHKKVSYKIIQLDISKESWENGSFDLVIAYDILEHLTEQELETALKNIKESTNKHILFSIPFLGDPNLEADKTHKIKESREWWEYRIKQAGFKILETPANFIFRNQLILGEKQ